MEFLKITDSLGNVRALPVTTNSSPKKETFMKFFKKLTKQNGTSDYTHSSNPMQAKDLQELRELEAQEYQRFLKTGYSNVNRYYLCTDNIDEYPNWQTWMTYQQDWDYQLNILTFWNWNEDGQLMLNFILPRKGYVLQVIIDSITNDELDQVAIYLQKHLNHLNSLWSPINV